MLLWRHRVELVHPNSASLITWPPAKLDFSSIACTSKPECLRIVTLEFCGELLDDVALVAGAFSITAWNFKSGLVSQWPPITPEESAVQGHCRPRDLLEYDAPIWSAVHHDCKGHSETGKLVATSRSASGSSGALMYTPNSKLISKGATYDELLQQTVVLQTDAMISQLAVENGRACFIVETAEELTSLWMINLVDFDTLDDFRTKAPKPVGGQEEMKRPHSGQNVS
jgi:hypothetical protein